MWLSSSFGTAVKISLFGESHGTGIGVVIDGLPPGEPIDLGELALFMARRAPGRDKTSTARKEADLPAIQSGFYRGVTCGTPLCAVIANTDTHSSDYSTTADLARPSHADYTGYLRYHGHQDIRGGGHFSGRLTAPLCFAGGVIGQMLRRRGITIGAHLKQVGTLTDTLLDPVQITALQLASLAAKPFPTLDDRAGELMRNAIERARLDCDSVGGIVECAAVGLPAGIGSPMFDGLENSIAQILFGIPAVKGVEFGTGFAAAALLGSQNNDAFYMDGDLVKTRTNRHGGILGGISTGMPLLVSTAFKPTPSIAKVQNTVNFINKTDTTLQIIGRHDPCIAVRAVPVVESAVAIALAQFCL